jgi:hypothetical protein
MISRTTTVAEQPSVHSLSMVFGEQGYSDEIRLRPDELVTLRHITTECWLEVIRCVCARQAKAIRETRYRALRT